MTPGTIRTVDGRGRASFVTRGSRFVGHVAPVTAQAASTTVVEAAADDHPDATHVVWAHRLAGDPPRERADDDGEPGGSAGDPTLTVLRREELLDVVAVVVRYYGGTNLGYGGLVRAYGRAVGEALEASAVVEREPTEAISIEVDYDDSGTVRAVLDSEDLPVEATYEETVTFEVTVPRSRMDDVVDRLRSATSGAATIRR